MEDRQETSPYLGETEEMREQRETGALIFRSKEFGFCLGGGRELHKDPGRSVYNVVFPTGS